MILASVKGIPAPIVGAMAENSTLFLSYREIQNIIRQTNNTPLAVDLSLPQLALAAAVAGTITSFVLFVRSSRHYFLNHAISRSHHRSFQNSNRTREM
jgi:hypothetical protein